MTYLEADHPRAASGTYTKKIQSAPEASLLTGHAAATAAGIRPGVTALFRESSGGRAEPVLVISAEAPDSAHPDGGEFNVQVSAGDTILAWWAELEISNDLTADVAMAAMTPSQLASARIIVERAQAAHHQTRRELEKVSVDAARTALADRFPIGSTAELFKPYDEIIYTLSRVTDANETVIWSSLPGETAPEILEINGYLAAGGGRTVAAFKRLNSQLGSYLEVNI
jgi:hypothetical protein